jgi:agmatine/peptidylarginine deiminase
MKKIYLLSFALFSLVMTNLWAQEETGLPIWSTPEELQAIQNGNIEPSANGERTFTTNAPTGTEVRTPGQWEELQAVIITWTSFPSIHRQLVSAIQQECEVWIVTQDSTGVKNNILSNGGNLTNVKFVHAPFNSIWVRDYGPNSVYLAGVDSLAFVDWRYNRNRPNDNNVPAAAGNQMNIDVYSMTALP